jgi:hypothetical protein
MRREHRTLIGPMTIKVSTTLQARGRLHCPVTTGYNSGFVRPDERAGAMRVLQHRAALHEVPLST